ncbi:MAG: Npt1/Npt2 family nucleotide transporter [Cyclobacteriaceae bacterium]
MSLIAFGVLHLFGRLDNWLLYIFYVEVALFAVLSASQFWILVNVVLNLREAKRLFGLIGSGAIAGGIFGGYLTSLAAPIFGSEYLLFLCAALIAICIPITNTLWHKYVTPTQPHLRQVKRTSPNTEHPFTLIRQSKHLSLIAGILAVSVVVSKLVDFQFSAMASSTYTDSDELASFFGFWFSTMNIFSLVIQLFLTKKIVGRYGVGFSLFLLPLGILIPGIFLIFVPQLWVAILLRVNEGSLKQSINKAGIELLMLPIPLEVKNQTKTFIDVFVDSLATGVGGLILILFVSVVAVPVKFISIMTIILIALWLYMARKVRNEYLRSFQLKMANAATRKDKKNIDISNESVLGGLRKVLTSGSDGEILFVLGKLKETTNSTFVSPLLALLDHSNPRIKAAALARLYYYKDLKITDQVKSMINDPEDEVRIAAFEYLIEHCPTELETLMNQYLIDEDLEVRGAALVSLSIETRDNITLKEKFDLKGGIEKATQAMRYGNEATIAPSSLLEAIGDSGLTEYYSFIHDRLNHEDEVIARAAVKAAAHTLSDDFVLPLIQVISRKELQKEVIDALMKFGLGLIDEASRIIEGHKDVNDIRSIALLLERLHSQSSVDLLFVLIAKGDINTQGQALKSLNQLKVRFPHLNYYKKATIDLILNEAKNYTDTLAVLYAQRVTDQSEHKSTDEISDARNSLVELLERRLEGNLERIFYLLGLKYSPTDILSIYNGIQSKKPDLYFNAVEFLDNLLDTSLKKVLMPLVETTLLDNISRDALEQLNIRIPNQYECFELILEGKDQRLKLAVLHLIKVLKETSYLPLAVQYQHDENIKVRTFALKAIQTLNG